MSDEEWTRLDPLIDEARQCYDNEEYEKAINLYHEILKAEVLEYEQRAAMMAEFGYCYFGMSNFDLTVKTLRTAEELKETLKDNSGFCRVLGFSYFELGNYERALIYQERAIRISTDFEEKKLLLYQLGRSHIFAGDSKIAIKYLKKYLATLEKNDIDEKMDTMYNLGFANLQLGRQKQAEKSFQYLINNNRNSEDFARGYYGLTELHYHEKQFENAKKFGLLVLEHDSKFSERETVLYYLIMIFSEERSETNLTKFANLFVKDYPNSERITVVKPFCG